MDPNPTTSVVSVALFAALALASGVPAEPPRAGPPGEESLAIDFDPGAFDALSLRPAVEEGTARVVFVTGVVDAIEKDFLGRPERVAIVSVSDRGVLLQNAVEDMSAGEALKDHVGEGVTARGVVLVKTDGTMSLLVDAFQIHGDEGGFVGDDADDDDD